MLLIYFSFIIHIPLKYFHYCAKKVSKKTSFIYQFELFSFNIVEFIDRTKISPIIAPNIIDTPLFSYVRQMYAPGAVLVAFFSSSNQISCQVAKVAKGICQGDSPRGRGTKAGQKGTYPVCHPFVPYEYLS